MSDQPSPRVPAWPPRSAPRLFVPQAITAGQTISVEGNQAHYLSRVMRMSPGDVAIVCDDRTGEWAMRAVSVGKRNVELEPVERLRPREQVPDIWLCPALLKKDRFDMVLEKATELGVREIHPVLARRCVADKLNPDRAATIVTEAAEQCARTALPRLHRPARVTQMLNAWPEDRLLFFADELGGETATQVFSHGQPGGILVGPEGGWDDAEREAIAAHPQARPISLGPRILRAETAAIAALSVWMASAGDWHEGSD